MDFLKKFFIFLFSIFIAGCADHNDSKALNFSGTLELTEHLVGTKIPGRLTTVSVEEGDQVKQGQLIATLDRFEQAKKDFERVQGLLKKGGATQQSFEYAALAVEDQQVVAPIDGIVLVKVHESGETVPAGSPVVVIGDRKSLWVRIFVPEGMVNRIHLDQSASLHVDGIDQNFPAHVKFISPQAEFTPRNVQSAEERVTQAFAVKVVLDNPPEFLRPGVAADVSLEPKE